MEEKDLEKLAQIQARVDVLQSLLTTVIMMLPDRAMRHVQHEFRNEMKDQEKQAASGAHIDKDYATQLCEIVSELNNDIDFELEQREDGGRLRLIDGAAMPLDLLQQGND